MSMKEELRKKKKKILPVIDSPDNVTDGPVPKTFRNYKSHKRISVVDPHRSMSIELERSGIKRGKKKK